MEPSAAAQASPNPLLTPLRLFPCSNKCCMQKMLLEGEKTLDIQGDEPNMFGERDRCAPMPACPISDFSRRRSLSNRFPRPFWRFGGWCGGTGGGRCPSTARTSQVPPSRRPSKKEKKQRATPGSQAVWDGHRYAGRVTLWALWATPTPPQPCFTGMERRHCTGRWNTAIWRPSARSSAPAHRWTSRTAAGGPFGAVGAVDRCGRGGPVPPLPTGPRRCTWRVVTAVTSASSARSSTPAHRWTSRTAAGGPFGLSARPLVRSARFRFRFARRDTPLQLAVEYGNLRGIHALIRAGASLDIQCPFRSRWAFWSGRRGR